MIENKFLKNRKLALLVTETIHFLFLSGVKQFYLEILYNFYFNGYMSVCNLCYLFNLLMCLATKRIVEINKYKNPVVFDYYSYQVYRKEQND